MITVRNSLAFFLSFVYCISVNASAQSSVRKNHEIPLDSARKYIDNLKKDAVVMKIKGGMFSRDVFDKILSQKGCVGLRYYYAKMDDGTPTIVVVGVDSAGRDMSTGTIAERINPCPPDCDPSSPIAK